MQQFHVLRQVRAVGARARFGVDMRAMVGGESDRIRAIAPMLRRIHELASSAPVEISRLAFVQLLDGILEPIP